VIKIYQNILGIDINTHNITSEARITVIDYYVSS